MLLLIYNRNIEFLKSTDLFLPYSTYPPLWHREEHQGGQNSCHKNSILLQQMSALNHILKQGQLFDNIRIIQILNPK